VVLRSDAVCIGPGLEEMDGLRVQGLVVVQSDETHLLRRSYDAGPLSGSNAM